MAGRLILTIFLLATVISAQQRVAMIQPKPNRGLDVFVAMIRSDIAHDNRVLDDSLVEAAFRSVEVADPFNMSTAEARAIGEVTGSDYLVIVRSAIQRRAALGSPAYFEAYSVFYLVESRSGRLCDWQIASAEGKDAEEAKNRLLGRTSELARKINGALKVNRPAPKLDRRFEEVPAETSVLAKGLRTPIPYRRIRPQYTELASNYGIRATIDIEVDIDAEGVIARTSLERWAGFGLDESVEKAVRSMNWRPAERDGKFLPMRVLLRYNFTKLEKDEAP